MYIEISNLGIVALFFAFLYTAFCLAINKLYLNNPRRVVYALVFGSVLLALLVLFVVLC